MLRQYKPKQIKILDYVLSEMKYYTTQGQPEKVEEELQVYKRKH